MVLTYSVLVILLGKIMLVPFQPTAVLSANSAMQIAAILDRGIFNSTTKQLSDPRGYLSVYVQVLHPLIAGNCRVTLLAAISAEGRDFLDTINTLRLVCRIQNITTRMAHNQGAELDLLPLSQALPADVRPSVVCWTADLLLTLTVQHNL